MVWVNLPKNDFFFDLPEARSPKGKQIVEQDGQ